MLSKETENYRLVIWKIIIADLNYSTLLITPGLIIMKTLSSIPLKFSKLTAFLIFYTLYIIWLVSLLLKESIVAKAYNNPDLMTYVSSFKDVFSSTNQFNFISKIGVCVIAALSGFSMARIPFNYFRRYEPELTHTIKNKIEDDISAKMEEIRLDTIELYKIIPKHTEETNEEKIPLFKSNIDLFNPKILFSMFEKEKQKKDQNLPEEKLKKKIYQNQSELDTLYIDYYELSEETEKIRHRTNQTLKFIIDTIGAHYLAVVSSYKFINTLRLIIMGRGKPSDPFTRILRFIAKYVII